MNQKEPVSSREKNEDTSATASRSNSTGAEDNKKDYSVKKKSGTWAQNRNPHKPPFNYRNKQNYSHNQDPQSHPSHHANRNFYGNSRYQQNMASGNNFNQYQQDHHRSKQNYSHNQNPQFHPLNYADQNSYAHSQQYNSSGNDFQFQPEFVQNFQPEPNFPVEMNQISPHFSQNQYTYDTYLPEADSAPDHAGAPLMPMNLYENNYPNYGHGNLDSSSRVFYDDTPHNPKSNIENFSKKSQSKYKNDQYFQASKQSKSNVGNSSNMNDNYPSSNYSNYENRPQRHNFSNQNKFDRKNPSNGRSKAYNDVNSSSMDESGKYSLQNGSYRNNKHPMQSSSKNMHQSNFRNHNRSKAEEQYKEKQEDGYNSKIEQVIVKRQAENSRKFKGKSPNSDQLDGKNALVKQDEDIQSLKDRMIDQLNLGNYECMVCCESIKQTNPIWSCTQCYHCFHLLCIKKWAQCENSSIAGEEGWRCPGCQNIIKNVPTRYMCFCGKKRRPYWNHHDTPHTCGEVCKKPLKGLSCPHFCTMLCHPGPCQDCTIMITKECECKKTKQVIRCGKKEFITCSSLCDKKLNCGVHVCESNCHAEKCQECQRLVEQECHCGKNKRSVKCTAETSNQTSYSCETVCEKALKCEFHKCTKMCHEGDCNDCQLQPDLITYCPCGKRKLEDIYGEKKVKKRVSCADPIPSCGQICQKTLVCGPSVNHHKCQAVCHEGPCPPCPLISPAECKCGFQLKEVPCTDVETNPVKCEKRCNKKLSCKRHKCLEKCCSGSAHVCDLVCDRRLSCQLHNCPEPCHGGDCLTCWEVNFDELHCECGAAVIYPPIPCGTKRPKCDEMCTRQHSCEHPVQHSCHDEPTCPPCTFLVSKWCYGKHELRKSIPCYLEYISCGKPCNKRLPCEIHTCQKTCHAGNCNGEEKECEQLCNKPRSNCGHPCGQLCHKNSDCPSSVCKYKVSVSCECGRRAEKISCTEYNNPILSTSKLAAKAYDARSGQVVNLKDCISKSKDKRLDCDTECAAQTRNRQLALALQIENPDMSTKLGPPQYSDWLKDQTRANIRFVNEVLDKLNSLVTLSKESKHKSRSHAFPATKKDNRRIIHELAEYYGCEAQSVDNDPSRMVIVTAVKNNCWIPSTSVVNVVNREMGIVKAPPPINVWSLKGTSRSSPKKSMDYFNMTPL